MSEKKELNEQELGDVSGGKVIGWGPYRYKCPECDAVITSETELTNAKCGKCNCKMESLGRQPYAVMDMDTPFGPRFT